MTTTKRLLVLLVALALPLAMAATASGAPDCDNPKFADNPACQGADDGPVVVDVTMTLVNGEGLTSDCDDGDGIAGSIEMVKDGTDLSPTHDPVLGVWMHEVEWSRIYPDPIFGSSGIGFAGCHRMLLDPDEPEALLGALMISLDESGAIADILWHFDYWYVWGTRGKKTYLADFEQFTLSMDETTLTWVDHTPDVDGDTNGRLTAVFGMFYHHQGEGYQPLEPSPFRTMSFDVVAVPRPTS